MKETEATKTVMKKVAKELNDQLGLEPPILLDLKEAALKKKCAKAAALIDPNEDTFSDEVWEVLETMGVVRPIAEDDEESDDVEEESDDVEEESDDVEEESDDVEEESDDVEDDVEQAMGDTLVEDFKAARKLSELKEVAEAWECFIGLDLDSYKGLQGPKALRADMLALLPDELREQVEPKPVEKTDTKIIPAKLSKPKWKTVIELIVANPGITDAKVIQKLAEQDISMSANTVSVYVREIGYALELIRQK